MKELMKSAFYLVLVGALAMNFAACSNDDDDEKTPLQIRVNETSFDTYLPQGTLEVTVTLDNPDADMNAALLDVTPTINWSQSLEGGTAMPAIQLSGIAQGGKVAERILQFSYNLDDCYSATYDLALTYAGTAAQGGIHINAHRAYPLERQVVRTDDPAMATLDYQVNDALTALGVELDDKKELALERCTFYYSTKRGPLVLGDDTEECAGFEGVRQGNNQGQIYIVLGLLNDFTPRTEYSAVVRIKKTPDSSDDSYVMLELPFVIIIE